MISGIRSTDLRDRIILPVLNILQLEAVDKRPSATELLLVTSAQESGCGHFLAQEGGPALSPWQIEPATHDDLWKNFLAFRSVLASKVIGLRMPGMSGDDQLAGNLYYSCALARLIYFRNPMTLPVAGDAQAQWAAYKTVYNTSGGAATQAEFMANRTAVLAAA